MEDHLRDSICQTSMSVSRFPPYHDHIYKE